MTNVKYDSFSVTDADFPGFDEYDVITVNDFPETDRKIQYNNESNYQDELSQPGKSYTRNYSKEWDQLFSQNLIIEDLKKNALAGELRSSPFRSICWRCMLGILHNEPKQWLLELRTYRNHYSDLWVELQKNPWNVEGKNPFDNPLSQEEESIWQRYFSNEELKSIIHQDVVRTFPGVAFFRKESIQDLMVRILFCYARQNPSLCYRQGMHEILAPLIYVLHCDHQLLQQFNNGSLPNDDIFEILNPAYIEEDTYSIFKHVMNHIESSYRIKNMVPTSTGYFTPQVEDEKNCENEVISRLQYIKDNIFQASDPDLNKHLEDLDIPLHLFGIRWLRLLFGREFPFSDLLVLWDSIFAVDNFELVNYIVVSMLTAIRSILLAGDYMTCLKNLMCYPSGVEIMFVIEYALHLMNPSIYQAPAVTAFENKPVTLISKKNNKSRVNQASDNFDKTLAQAERLKNPKSTKWLSGKSHSLNLTGSGDGGGNIIEGFVLDDPKVLKSDLENMSSTLELVRNRLSNYYSILQNNLPEPVNQDVKTALDGIQELCSLLKTFPNQPTYTNIEPALEAGETKQILNLKKKASDAKKNSKSPNISEGKANTLPRAVKKWAAGELQVFKQCQGGTILGAPMRDPLRLMRKMSCDDGEDDDQ